LSKKCLSPVSHAYLLKLGLPGCRPWWACGCPRRWCRIVCFAYWRPLRQWPLFHLGLSWSPRLMESKKEVPASQRCYRESRLQSVLWISGFLSNKLYVFESSTPRWEVKA
jgi:hypothetical protein